MRSWADFEFDPEPHRERLLPLVERLQRDRPSTDREWRRILKDHLRPDGGFYSKAEINSAARAWKLPFAAITKPTRTRSGVAPVTLFTQPYACPGQCIYCPNDVRAPKAYLADEPGVQRARSVGFDPYAQTWNRLLALFRLGHPVSKVEIVILGGTWSNYPEAYQVAFVRGCLRALNDFDGSKNPGPIHGAQIEELPFEITDESYNVRLARQGTEAIPLDWPGLHSEIQRQSESSSKLVGLCIETRPDRAGTEEMDRWRRMGITKVQIGVQNLSDEVLRQNRRGHTAEQVRQTLDSLRLAGFKIQAHWMTNLLGADPELDRREYVRFVNEEHPDEIKLYPCQRIPGTELERRFRRGAWAPYSEDDQRSLLADLLAATPETVRLSRVVRDIPKHWVTEGGVDTNLREGAEEDNRRRGAPLRDLRSREIGAEDEPTMPFRCEERRLDGRSTVERFLSVVDGRDRVLGICRLSLPKCPPPFEELAQCAMIRELHVYGPAVNVGQAGRVQHRGLGEQLISRAVELAKEAGFLKLAVIAAVGTRSYYERFGFVECGRYWIRAVC